MPKLSLTALFALASLLLSQAPARAFERPDATPLNDGWEIRLCEPLTDIVKDRQTRPDWPYLSPELSDLVSPGDNLKAPKEGWLPAQAGLAWEHYGGADYNQAGWYRQDIALPSYMSAPGLRVWLEFDAVSTVAAVWCNGQYLGGHVGDFARWRVELTEANVDGHADVLIYVDELPFHTTQGFLGMIAPHHGGIWQDVRLYATGPAGIVSDSLAIDADSGADRIHVSFDLDTGISQAELHPEASLSFSLPLSAGSRSELQEALQISDLEIAEGTASFHCALPQALRPWSPDSPQMYELRVELYQGSNSGRQLDAVLQKFAFRDIEMQGHNVLLNGEPVIVRSALQWGYYPGVFGPVPTPQQVRDEFAYIKTLGFNAETVCLVNMPDYYYDIADEMGILIWQEYPSWHALFSPGEERTLQRQYRDFVNRDRNHPSIIMRSLSVEAGVEDWDVMSRLYDMVKSNCNTPVQDNNSWFSHSRPEYTDWYGEDNYFNNYQWQRHLFERLPGQLAELPAKPYIIGESLLCNTWVDADALQAELEAPQHFGYGMPDNTPGDYLGNTSGTDWPWWFPSCFESVLETNARLRGFYAGRLPEGEDIVNDYLLPQSTRASLNMRRFQIEALDAQPYMGGYTLNVVRDMPLIRAGLFDDLGRPRWSAEDWAWHGDSEIPPAPFQVFTAPLPLACTVMEEGYLDLHEVLGDLPNARYLSEAEIYETSAMDSPVIVTSVLTHGLVDYIGTGGRVVLLCSKMPGALNAQPHFFWRDALFVPPVGPFSMPAADGGLAQQVVDWQGYDLNRTSGNVIPVDTLGIRDSVDPLIRLFDTHDLSEVVTYDQLLGTRIGRGTLVASSVDIGTPSGRALLLELFTYLESSTALATAAAGSAPEMNYLDRSWPATALSLEQAHGLAVARANGIMDLTPGWKFSLDENAVGDELGWGLVNFDDSAWATIDAGKGWESAGYSYDGQAWYRRTIAIPADWQGGKVRLVAEGIDDAYNVWVNGKVVASHGSFTDHELTVWLQQTVSDITDALNYGEENTLALQVMDITGQGGIWRPVYLAVE